MDFIRTASAASKATKASEHIEFEWENPVSLQINDELVEVQDDLVDRPITVQSELHSAKSFASLKWDDIEVNYITPKIQIEPADDKSLQSFKSAKLDEEVEVQKDQNKNPRQRIKKRTKFCSIATLISGICVATILFIALSGFLIFWLFAFLVIDAKDQHKGLQKDEIKEGNKENKENKQQRRRERKLRLKKNKRRAKIVSLTTLVSSICSVTIVFIWYHLQGNELEIVNGQNIQQEITSNESCSFWHITADEYCDDEANIAECGYDFKDCCHMDNDRSLCTDCLCYMPEEEKIMLDDEYNKNCQNVDVWAWGDGGCDLSLNNKENYFDVGDCCLKNPKCLSSIFQTSYEECPENVCIQSNIFCILEELGDGICQAHNNGPLCQYDLGDCCLVPGNFTSCSCNCECKNDIFIYDYDSFMQTNVAGIKGIKD